MTHYYEKEQNSSLREKEINVSLNGQNFLFFSVSALFSKDHLDKATELLIKKADLTNAKEVLDLGCGWGPVAIILKLQNPEMNFTATDVSDRAIIYTRKNAKKHGVKIEVIQSSLFENIDEKTFDTILTNPPYVAGRETCKNFILESFKHLKKGGSLQLVARHNKGGKFLGNYMKDLFGNVEHIAKQSGFRIYKSIK